MSLSPAMCSSALTEVLSQVLFSFTRSVTEHYNPQEPEFTAESFGYDPLQSTGVEWNYQPVDELIYQEYSDREVTDAGYLAACNYNVRVIEACSPEDDDAFQDDQQPDEDRSMAWKRLRPSVLRTVGKSMYIAASISLLAAFGTASIFLLVSYLCLKILGMCYILQNNSNPSGINLFKFIAYRIARATNYISFTCDHLFFLFRPYQVIGVRRKLILIVCAAFALDVLYSVILLALGKPCYSFLRYPAIYAVPFYVIPIICGFPFYYFLVLHFGFRSWKKIAPFICKMASPVCLTFTMSYVIKYCIYPLYSKQGAQGKLVIALFAPLLGVLVKVITRILVQRLWNIVHPGYAYTLLTPVYFGSAMVFRVLQADLDSLQSIAILGIIHGASEVIERSTVAVIDHIFLVIWHRKTSPWGSFRTPRRERLMADITIMSMLYESTAIVSSNGFLYLYQFIYVQDDSFLKLLQEFALHTAVQLVIEWFFTSLSLAIQTRYQNVAVMAVWQRRWKRHLSVAIVNAVPISLYTSAVMVMISDNRSETLPSQP